MKRHRFDPISFVVGLVFALFAAAAVWEAPVDWNVDVWIMPAAVLILGIGLLVSTLRASITKDDDAPQ